MQNISMDEIVRECVFVVRESWLLISTLLEMK